MSIEDELAELAQKLPRIRITSVPKGNAPLEIKKKWIGVEIPCIYFDSVGAEELADVVGGAQTASYRSYCVFQFHAIAALEALHPDAAKWWRDNGFPRHLQGTFAFSAESVEPLGEIKTRSEFFGTAN